MLYFAIFACGVNFKVVPLGVHFFCFLVVQRGVASVSIISDARVVHSPTPPASTPARTTRSPVLLPWWHGRRSQGVHA